MFKELVDDGKRATWGPVRGLLHGREIEHVTEFCGDCYVYLEGGLCLIAVRGGLAIHDSQTVLAILDYGPARETLSEAPRTASANSLSEEESTEQLHTRWAEQIEKEIEKMLNRLSDMVPKGDPDADYAYWTMIDECLGMTRNSIKSLVLEPAQAKGPGEVEVQP